MHGHVVPVVEHPQRRLGPIRSASSVLGERRLAEPYNVEEPVQQPARAGRGDGPTPVTAPVHEPLGAVVAVQLQHQVARPGFTRDAPSEPLAGLGHLPVHRVHQWTRATDQCPPGADRPERPVRQPGRIDTLHETPNAVAQASSSTSDTTASPSSTRRYFPYVPGDLTVNARVCRSHAKASPDRRSRVFHVVPSSEPWRVQPLGAFVRSEDDVTVY